MIRRLLARLRAQSNLAAAALIAAGLALPSAVSAETIRAGGTGSALGTLAALADAYRQVDPAFKLTIVPNLGSSGGINALQTGSIDLAVTSRPLKPNETAAGLHDMAYGRTPFVMATVKQGVDSLTQAEIADIYAGRQRRWADGQPIRLVLRPASDGDTALLASFSPQIKEALDSAMAREGMVTGVTDQEATDAIERLPGGLGTTTLALLRSEQRSARALAIDGIEPSAENVANGRYRYVKTMYFALRSNAPDTLRRFLDFVASEAGRRVLAQMGNVAPLPR